MAQTTTPDGLENNIREELREKKMKTTEGNCEVTLRLSINQGGRTKLFVNNARRKETVKKKEVDIFCD